MSTLGLTRSFSSALAKAQAQRSRDSRARSPSGVARAPLCRSLAARAPLVFLGLRSGAARARGAQERLHRNGRRSVPPLSRRLGVACARRGGARMPQFRSAQAPPARAPLARGKPPGAIGEALGRSSSGARAAVGAQFNWDAARAERRPRTGVFAPEHAMFRGQVVFPNGLRKVVWPASGRTVVTFPNGDVKESFEDASVRRPRRARARLTRRAPRTGFGMCNVPDLGSFRVARSRSVLLTVDRSVRKSGLSLKSIWTDIVGAIRTTSLSTRRSMLRSGPGLGAPSTAGSCA